LNFHVNLSNPFNQGSDIFPYLRLKKYHHVKNTLLFLFLFLFLDTSTCHAENPSISWATYFGGKGGNTSNGVVTDASGNVYITGFTYADSNIATKGSHQTMYGGDGDVFLAKFNPKVSLLWATYYGGNSADYGYSIAIDTLGYVYITGLTYSNNGIATSGAYKTVGDSGGNGDAFLAKFDSSGSLVWGTYFGGNNVDWANSVDVDKQNNVNITGYTNSTVGIATSGAYQTSYSTGVGSAFLAKFKSSGSLSWSTYYGGNGDDIGEGITHDGNNNLYLTGYTSSTSGIATSGAYQTTNAGGEDVFVAKFSSSGSLSWGTYYGGSGDDGGRAIIADENNNVYVTGSTASDSSIATSGAYQTSFGGGFSNAYGIFGDAFLAKFSSSGSLSWATYYGGAKCDAAGSITACANNIYIAGLTSSLNGITTSNAYQSIYAGDTDAFLAKFTSSGSLIWSTYYGGAKFDGGYGIIDDNNNIYVTGCTESPSGIATSGAYKTVGDGVDGDGFLAKFYFPSSFTPFINGSNSACPDSRIIYYATLDGATTYSWKTKGGAILSGENKDTVELKWINYGNDTLWLTESSGICTDSIMNVILVAPPVAHIARNTGICVGGSTFLRDTAISGHFYTWTSQPSGFASDSANPSVSPTVTTTYYLIESDTMTGCRKSDSVIVTVNQFPAAYTGNNKSICTGDSLIIGGASISGHTYIWNSYPYGFFSTISNPWVSPTATTTYYLIEMDSGIYYCWKSDSVIISVNPKPVANAGVAKSICSGDSATIGDTAVSGNSYSWISNPAGFTSTRAEASPAPTATTTYILTETVTATGCSKSDSVIITVNPLPIANTGTSKVICSGDSTTIGGAAVTGDSYSWVSSPVGFTSTSAGVSPAPTATTTYILTETVTTTGCSKSDSVIITVNPLPVALFAYKLFGDTVKFTPANTTYTSYLWSFGDSDTSDQVSPSHSYSNNGEFTVSLMVTDKKGCSATYKTTDTINYTGIANTRDNNLHLSIYPNPSSNTFIISLDTKQENAEIALYNVMGKKLAGFTLTDVQKFTLKASDYSMKSGVYILSVRAGNSIYIGKLVVE